VRPDGKLDREKALHFLSQTSGFGGGWTGGTRAPGLNQRAAALLEGGPKRQAAPSATVATGPRGAALDPEDLAIYVAWKLCKSARETFGELFAGAYPDDAGQSFPLRVWATWISSYLLECWAEDFLALPLPPIDWSHFGDRAKEARRLARAFAKEFSDTTPQPAAKE
jgi:hypothetical protein